MVTTTTTPTTSSYHPSSSSSSSTSGNIITVAACTLNQWALDFDGNLARIVESCRQAKARGATYRLGPELEVPGYGCEDHFLESDTLLHSWESLVELLLHEENLTHGMLCDFGMPLLHRGCRYNCRVLCYDSKILLVRPKTALADSGNYRESRHFTAYQNLRHGNDNDDLLLPQWVQDRLGPGHPRKVPFGLAYVETNDGVKVGCESCEELWTPLASHIGLALQGGVEIIGNGSGSHHELRKLDQRLELMVSATRKSGGVYLYSNQRGCDGGRLYYDGGAIIVCNGEVLAQAPQFGLDDVAVVTATVDLDDVRSYRAGVPSFGTQAVQQHGRDAASPTSNARLVDAPQARLLSNASDYDHHHPISEPISLRWSTPEEECCLGPACWLWDYLRRSGASGFLLPLSGGADSSAVATIVAAMCHLAYENAVGCGGCGGSGSPGGEDGCHDAKPSSNNRDDNMVLKDLRRICRQADDWTPSSPQEIASHVLHTVFMGTENSSNVTTSRARRLGGAVGSYHLTVRIDLMVRAVVQVFALTTGRTPRFLVHGGTLQEDLALQNIQARLRMVTAYLFAQLLPWTRGRSAGFLLVLGSANVDEGLRGYLTKYDCSSADLNPIGAISKGDLKRMLLWAADRYGHPVLAEIAAAPPTAELRPNKGGGSQRNDGATDGGGEGEIGQEEEEDTAEHSQLDEEEMGMSYAELGWFGRLRKISRCGPVSMYRRLVVAWATTTSGPAEVAAKVKAFFYHYAANRHKMCTLTPSYHAEAYSPDDNRFDLRPFLYNTAWPRQFAAIDRLVEQAAVATRQRHRRLDHDDYDNMSAGEEGTKATAVAPAPATETATAGQAP